MLHLNLCNLIMEALIHSKPGETEDSGLLYMSEKTECHYLDVLSKYSSTNTHVQ